MAEKIKTLVALDTGVGKEFVEASLPKEESDSRRARGKTAANSAGSWVTCIPFPPPPRDGLIIKGNPMLRASAASRASV